LDEILSLSQRVVVMSNKGKSILVQACGADASQIDVIPHGCPDVCPTDGVMAKLKTGYIGKKLVLTFGLLSPDKGIEVAIRAMRQLVDENPDLLYLVLGATHPQIKRNRGEEYRDSLRKLAADLGLQDHVVFDDRYVSTADLLLHLQAADVYLTPYLNPKQITSGTLAYAFGCGKAIVSTPYWHAQEILADGNGVLVPFGEADATAKAISVLLSDPQQRAKIGSQAYAASRATTWSSVGFQYARTFAQAMREKRLDSSVFLPVKIPLPMERAEVTDLTHLIRLTDDTGIIQHAKRALPLRAEGYCIDDNARALLLCARLGRKPETERLA
jgi:glycosyltransferase involved in cell wall biosynthesis